MSFDAWLLVSILAAIVAGGCIVAWGSWRHFFVYAIAMALLCVAVWLHGRGRV